MKKLEKVKSPKYVFETNIELISVVVPSVNGDYAKLLILKQEDYKKIRKMADFNRGKNMNYFALFMETNVYHELLNKGFGGLTKMQFDEIIKSVYNSVLVFDETGEKLKEII